MSLASPAPWRALARFSGPLFAGVLALATWACSSARAEPQPTALDRAEKAYQADETDRGERPCK